MSFLEERVNEQRSVEAKCYFLDTFAYDVLHGRESIKPLHSYLPSLMVQLFGFVDHRFVCLYCSLKFLFFVFEFFFFAFDFFRKTKMFIWFPMCSGGWMIDGEFNTKDADALTTLLRRIYLF